MTNIKCPSCGAPNVEQVEEGKYQCPYCGSEFNYSSNEKAPIFTNEEITNVENHEERSTNIFDILEWGFYAIAAIDFCGMFFGYDITGVSWSPIVFCVIAYFFNWLANNKQKDIINK